MQEMYEICPTWYLYFVLVLGLMWSDYPESCTSGGVANGTASHAGWVIRDDPGKKGYPGPPGWRLGHEASKITSIKKNIVEKSNNEYFTVNWRDEEAKVEEKEK
jgi:hypothetical protein